MEIIKLMLSYNLNAGNFPDFNIIQNEYIQLDNEFLEMVLQTLTFDKASRPKWDYLLNTLLEFDHKISEIYDKIKSASSKINKDSTPNFDYYVNFMEKVNSGEIQLKVKSNSGNLNKMRILSKTQSNQNESNSITKTPQMEKLYEQADLINAALKKEEIEGKKVSSLLGKSYKTVSYTHLTLPTTPYV